MKNPSPARPPELSPAQRQACLDALHLFYPQWPARVNADLSPPARAAVCHTWHQIMWPDWYEPRRVNTCENCAIAAAHYLATWVQTP